MTDSASLPQLILEILPRISTNVKVQVRNQERLIVAATLTELCTNVYGSKSVIGFQRVQVMVALQDLSVDGRVKLYEISSENGREEWMIEYIYKDTTPIPEPSIKPHVDLVAIWRKLRAERAAAGLPDSLDDDEESDNPKNSNPKEQKLIDLIDL
jgi:hypothetical protein